MTEAEIKGLVQQTADETAKRVVHETFLMLGIDMENPLEVQADMQHLRSWRTSTAAVKKQGLTAAIGILVSGTIGLLWLAFTERLGR